MNYKFKLNVENWNLVEEVGLPEDDTWCFIVWKSNLGDLEWGYGGYNKDENIFYCNMGLGGIVNDAENVIAWKDIEEVELEEAMNRTGKMIGKALDIAKMAHENQVDKGGQPYFRHPFEVAEMVETEEEKIVALLHDVCEDSSVTLEDLSHEGFNSDIVNAVDAITKRDGETYDDYLKRVQANPLATKVKIADLTHNSDLSRIPNPNEKDYQRREKYQRVLKQLVDEK